MVAMSGTELQDKPTSEHAQTTACHMRFSPSARRERLLYSLPSGTDLHFMSCRAGPACILRLSFDAYKSIFAPPRAITFIELLSPSFLL
jgi:hypothetical protein